MSYVAAIDHLHGLGLELAPSALRRKFDLAHMRVLVRALGDPQTKFPAVLIAGTNGKGSTAATLGAILAAAGLRTGLYTSPHLARVTERIRIADAEAARHSGAQLQNLSRGLSPLPAIPQPATFLDIPEDSFARLYFRIDETAQQLVSAGELPHHPSFFECLTALAFLYFAEQHVDIAILEVGMGGRLDATNVVEPILSIISDIALDHQEFLGNTIAEIAHEKAGILRPNGTLITLPQHPEANRAIGETAVALNVQGINAADYLPDRSAAFATPTEPVPHSSRSDEWDPTSRAAAQPNAQLPANHYDLNLHGETLRVRSPLAGEHQRRNLALAIAAAIELRNKNSYIISNAAIEAGIANTTWPGRLEFLPPNLLLDVAHNPAGAWTLRAAIATLPESQPRTLIFSCLRDKDLTEMARILFPLFDSTSDRPHDHIIFAPINNPRTSALDDLLAAARALDIPAHAADSASQALALARSLTPANGLILATGSIYLVGALREAVLAP
jgi:dihydrofolate synthase/folylpolyglutamate synthase